MLYIVACRPTPIVRCAELCVLLLQDGPVTIPERESASKKGSVPVYQRQKHEERPPSGVETRTEEKVMQ